MNNKLRYGSDTEMKSKYNSVHDIEVKGQYIYINGHSLRFDSDEQAEDFLIRLIVKEGLMDR